MTTASVFNGSSEVRLTGQLDGRVLVSLHCPGPARLEATSALASELRAALDELVPAGSYTRTDEGAHIGPEGETDWHGLYLSENRRAEKAERALVEMTAHRDQCRDTAIKWQTEANRAEKPRPLDLFEKHRTLWGIKEARREFLEQGLTYKDVRRIVELTFTPEPDPDKVLADIERAREEDPR